MKKKVIVLLIASIGTMPALVAHSMTQESAKQDVKDAGHDTKEATKKAERALQKAQKREPRQPQKEPRRASTRPLTPPRMGRTK